MIRKFLIHQKINRKSIRINIPLPVVLQVIDEYNKTHGVLTEPSLQEREQGIGKRNDGTGMEEEMKEESAPVGRPIHRRRTRKGCAISEVLQEITVSASVQQGDEKQKCSTRDVRPPFHHARSGIPHSQNFSTNSFASGYFL